MGDKGRKNTWVGIQLLLQWGCVSCLHQEQMALSHPVMGCPQEAFLCSLSLAGGSLAGDAPGDQELYVRWLQIVTFLPVMAFSTPPWLCCDTWVRNPLSCGGGHIHSLRDNHPPKAIKSFQRPDCCPLSTLFLLQNSCELTQLCAWAMCNGMDGTYSASGYDSDRHMCPSFPFADGIA